MALDSETAAWLDRALFDGGYTQLRLELTVHVASCTDDIFVGCALFDTPTNEVVAITTRAVTGSLVNPTELSHDFVRLIEEVRRRIEPFG